MYVDGFVLPLPADKIQEYKKLATFAGEVWMDHGALAYRECVLDPTSTPDDFALPFPKLVGTGGIETVVFAYILYRDRTHRDAVNAKVMADPRMKEGPGPDDMPFDMKRMAYGGFTSLVEYGSDK